LRDETYVKWSGKFRPALTGQGVFPRPVQAKLPIWLGVGGTPASFARAGTLGLPLMIAIIGGEPHRFRPLVDLYREAGKRAGHDPASLKVGIHALGYVAETDARAADDFFPGYAATFSKIGQERGWGPVTRRQFDALLGPSGALIVGGPETVIEKVKHYDEVLGGISRLDFQVSVAGLPHERLMEAIGILGRDVRPKVREAQS
jgi:alkanesulfonate monooxygenase SsuD/methylene tetrahydromethanopterin reductase-like flavin-dependent oxidoreductase (luciferase family)